MEENIFNEHLSDELEEKDDLFEQQFNAIGNKKESAPSIKEKEKTLLEKCHNTDIMAMLRKEFSENPIDHSVFEDLDGADASHLM